jgi:hypothetical protein
MGSDLPGLAEFGGQLDRKHERGVKDNFWVVL